MENNLATIQADIIERDRKDDLINIKNHQELISLGLKPYQKKRHIIIDTGIHVGIENVVNEIVKNVRSEDKIITIYGLSGTGKSSTADALAHRLNSARFSLGEIFRYLTYKYIAGEKDLVKIIKDLDYRFVDGKINLFDSEENISIKLVKELRGDELEKSVPAVAVLCQKEMIQFIAGQMSQLAKNTESRIIIEGRKFTLDFLPSDLEIELSADASIRALRRSQQIHS